MAKRFKNIYLLKKNGTIEKNGESSIFKWFITFFKLYPLKGHSGI